MSEFIKEFANIYRLKIPFDTVYTSVFLIKSGDKAVLVDCGTNAFDVDNFIIPALNKMGYCLDDLWSIVISHSHIDHAGGVSSILEKAPNIRVVSDEEYIDDEILIYPLPGHTKDSIGVLDLLNRVLISADGLQGAGVDKYRCSLASAKEYLKTLKKIEQDERVENILFSHAYEPWFCDCVFGRGAVLECINECKKYIGEN
ncbi:MAG: MBL fold metallo-hydrolase [Clostridia bacterium]|nr:MBL fold metallo-hydrolase [Clostridia bacterium]